ncbi:MAG: TetR/AcrR family transcriptional regulator [Acidimicrobiia bacterium]
MTFSSERSLARSERLIDAARDLATETASAGFTVAQVAERARASLKGFYACFPGKDDLLLGLLEEDSRVGATLVAEQVARHDDPVDRLRAYVHGLFSLVAHPGALGYVGVLVREHRRLGEERPDDLRAALAPLVDLLASELATAAAARRAAAPDPGRDAETIFGLLLAGVHEVTLGRRDPSDQAAYLWRFCWLGLASTANERSTLQEGL